MGYKFTVVSLFSGAGGMDIGFDNEGFKTIWANDNDKDSCETHKSWSKAEVVCAPIESVNLSSIPSADVVLGGFPCQGFSLAGPRKIDDKRNTLYRYFVEVIDTIKPKAFVAENVKGILTLGGGTIIDVIKKEFSDKGYEVQVKLLNAADYRVPEDRHRVIMVGIRKDLKVVYKYPEPTKKRATLKDAIGNMPKPNINEICTAPYSSRYMSRNRIRNWHEVSYTIPAMAKQVALHPSSPPMRKVHKDLWEFTDPKNTRRLSWREAAIIQTFPPNMQFSGNLTSIYKQIGNAVPVNLARAVAKELNKALTNAEDISVNGSDTNKLRKSVRILVS
ncbi:MAG TPA: DNA cytosine methyltransferase [Chitinophagaceae bacterium]|nr:DNA cytosine methyltransferase [Chitinophagaceae bacterium]